MLGFFIYYMTIVICSCAAGYYLGNIINQNFIHLSNSPKNQIDSLIKKVEVKIFTFLNLKENEEMTAKTYIKSLLLTNLILFTISFLLILYQDKINFDGMTYDQTLVSTKVHTVVSYITNTNQSHLLPEINLTYLSKYFLLNLLMFTCGTTGLSIPIMFIRAVSVSKIGNFYVDSIKCFTRILFPGAMILSIILCACGCPNTLNAFLTYDSLEGIKNTIQVGPYAAYEAMKMFGQNGGNISNVNSAHPFSNPNELSNLLITTGSLIVPTALIFALGNALENKKQAITLLCVLFITLGLECAVSSYFELRGNIIINNELNINQPNWLGKETRIGINGSAVFNTIASNLSGATNSSMEAFHPATIAIAYFNLCIQAIFGGQGLGIMYVFIFLVYTAYFVGLMTGRTPLLFNRRIEKQEIILTSIILFINPISHLFATAIALLKNNIEYSTQYERIHEFTRILYEHASCAANNGSGLEGLVDNTTFFNISTVTVMLCGWYLSIYFMIYLADSLKNKLVVITNKNHIFKTDTLLFSFLTMFIAITINLIVVFPFIIAGPIAEITSIK